MLPNFLGLGCGRCGTTSLHFILKKHPDIFLAPMKECHFWGNLSSNEVVARLQLARYEIGCFGNYDGEKMVSEISPSYLPSINAADNIAKHLGHEVKFIVNFRNPVDRAYSHYIHELKEFNNDTFSDFMDVISNKENIIHKASLYSANLERYLSIFPKENFLFIVYENDIRQHLDVTIKNILLFLGVSEDFIFEKRHEAGMPKYKMYHFDKQLTLHPLDTGKSFPLKADTLFLNTRNSNWDRLVKDTLFLESFNFDWNKIIHRPSNNLIDVFLDLEKKGSFLLNEELRQDIMKKYFIDDVHRLEQLIGMDLSIWY